MSSSTVYTLLDAAHPTAGLGQANLVSLKVIEYMSTEMTGKAPSDHLAHFTLGHFYIDAELLQQHPTQRPIDSGYVDSLVESFESGVIQRTKNAEVVIGLGEGWSKLKNTGEVIYRISKSSSIIKDLSICSGGAIGQIIRGGHPTEAVRQLFKLPKMGEENYWYYQVLLPSKSFINSDYYLLNIFQLPINFQILSS